MTRGDYYVNTYLKSIEKLQKSIIKKLESSSSFIDKIFIGF